MSVCVGLLDSGVAANQAGVVLAARGFTLADGGQVIDQAVTADIAGHGSLMAGIILTRAPGVGLLNAQAFHDAGAAAPAAVAAALDWLVAAGARVVNLSFGLREDRPALREACARAVAGGALLVAATPTRGGAVFPASYPGVLRVCGDARCGSGELSLLPDGPAHLGACPHAPGNQVHRVTGGASFAVAQVTGVIAAFYLNCPDASRQAAMRYLEQLALYRGRERRK